MGGGGGKNLENGQNFAKKCMNLKEFAQFFVDRKIFFPTVNYTHTHTHTLTHTHTQAYHLI